MQAVILVFTRIYFVKYNAYKLGLSENSLKKVLGINNYNILKISIINSRNYRHIY